MEFYSFPLGPLEVNCYLLVGETESGKEAVAIDPGGNPGPVLKVLEETGATLTHILNTHLHFDHIGGNKALADATGAKSYANPQDAYLLETELGRGGFMGLPAIELFDYEPLEPGTYTYAGASCIVMHTPGHTPGSLSFYFPDLKKVYVGDVVFYRSIGRTDFPGGDHSTLLESIRENLFSLPDETVILSGHGDPTSVGDERRHNPFLSEFS